jgi:hypothetical protein
MSLALAALPSLVGLDATPDPNGTSLLTAFTTAIGNNTTTIVGVFGAIIGLVFLIVLGNFIVKRVRGSVH